LINSGDTAWVLASSALVLLMTPGLAFFYGGMVRSRSVLNMLMMSFSTIALVSVLWVLYGFSLSFAPDAFHGLIGNLDYVGLKGTLAAVTGPKDHQTPLLAFSAFQLMFAIITPALISGAIADRAKFGGWLLFVGLWVTFVYFPVAHWVFMFDNGNGGWIGDRLKALDFAGGTAVHVNAGAAGLALAIVLGKRIGWPKDRFKPHNVPFVLLGAGLLWFGWFGFNAGSALAANSLSATAFVNTQVATAAALLGWILVERLRDGKATTLGAASGAVAGLVGITPACASLNPLMSVVLGLVVGAVCALAVGLKYKFGFDDSLDVVGVHMVGGAVGALLIGFLATATVTGGPEGLFFGGGLAQLGRQAIAVVAVGVYSFVLSWVLGKIVDKTVGFRLNRDDEATGIDSVEHAESAYDFGGLIAGHAARLGSSVPATAVKAEAESEPASVGKE
jgi:Amt family ammonium transporter